MNARELSDLKDKHIKEIVDVIKSYAPCTTTATFDYGWGEDNVGYSIEVDSDGHLEITDIETDYVFDETLAGYDTLYAIAQGLVNGRK